LQKYGPSSYQVPVAYIGLALLAIVVLVSATLLWHPSRSVPRARRRAWSPWLVGLLAFVHGLAWFVLIGLAYFPASSLPGVSPLIPIGMGLAWVGLALIIIRYLSRSQGWGDRQRLALIFGASLASMLGGVLSILSASPLDQVGKLVFDLVAILLFAGLARRLGRRATEASRYSRSTALDPEA